MTPKDFREIDKLYHYTRLDSAIRIILTNHLKFGRLGDMNDVNEAYKRISYEYWSDVQTKDVQYELKQYRQISLTMDSSTYQGFDISAMWGHYAEKGKGVCLVFENIGKSLERKRKGFFFTKSSDWKYEQEYRIITKIDSGSDDLFLDFKDSLIAVVLQYADSYNNYDPINDTIFSSFNFKLLDTIVKRNMLILEKGDLFGDTNLRDREGDSFSNID